MPKPYPAEFRRKVLDLLAAGRSVASLAADLGVSAQAIYNWRKQDAIDRGMQDLDVLEDGVGEFDAGLRAGLGVTVMMRRG